MSEHLGCFWDELIPEVEIALRFTVASTHGYRPCDIVFKQQVPHPCGVSLGAQCIASDDEVGAVTDELFQRWASVRPTVLERLRAQDDRMRRQHAR